MNKSFLTIAKNNTNKLNELEKKLALEYYGLAFEELNEDEKGEISFEAHEILGY